MAKAQTPTDLKQRFGQAVQAARHDLGVSQERLAELAGIHRTYLGDIERGHRNPALVNVCRIAEALRMRPSALFERMGM